MRRWGWWGVVVVAAVGAAPTDAVGQERILPPPAIILSGGMFSYDFDSGDSGSGAVFGARMDFPLSAIFTLEPGIDRMSWTPEEDGAEDRSLWVVDFAAHAEYAFDRLVPYLGGNLGAVLDFADDRSLDEEFIDASYGGHGGLRYEITDHLGVRAEARVRWIDDFDTRWTLVTGGVSWRF